MKQNTELAGSPNFRDIGGYLTEDGRIIKHGRVFRSGSLHRLMPSDVEALEQLAIALICDLRSREEVLKFPSIVSAERPPQVHNLAIWGTGGLTTVNDKHPVVEHANTNPEVVVGMIRNVYGHFAVQHAGEYRRMFDLLLNEASYPLIIHCTAGKDRTGIAIALIMRVLGVPEDAVIHEYELTNQLLIGKKREERIAAILPEGFKYDPNTVDALISARADYLAAAFDEIDRSFGDFEAYMKDGLGLDLGKLAKLQEHLLHDG